MLLEEYKYSGNDKNIIWVEWYPEQKSIFYDMFTEGNSLPDTERQFFKIYVKRKDLLKYGHYASVTKFRPDDMELIYPIRERTPEDVKIALNEIDNWYYQYGGILRIPKYGYEKYQDIIDEYKKVLFDYTKEKKEFDDKLKKIKKDKRIKG